MPNLVEKFKAEVGFLWGAKKPPPHVTRTQIYPAEDRVNICGDSEEGGGKERVCA